MLGLFSFVTVHDKLWQRGKEDAKTSRCVLCVLITGSVFVFDAFDSWTTLGADYGISYGSKLDIH
jgi:hypothetical protein